MRVIVIGGGIVGAGAAYHLTRCGVSTTLVDRADRGQATAAGAGVIFPWPFPGMAAEVRDFRLKAAAHYPALMAELADDGQDPTGYEVVGGISVSTDDAAADGDREALLRLAAQPGYEGIGEVTRLERGGPARRFPVLREDYSGVMVAGMARLNGRQARAALLHAAEERALRRRRGDAELIGDGTRVIGVRVGAEELRADAVVVAAGAWSAELLRPFGVELPVHPVRGQILHLAMPGRGTADWPIVRVGDRGHYMVTFAPNRVVVGATREPEAGFDHRVTGGGLHHVLSEALETAPGLAEATVVETRVGFRPAGRDGLQLLGGIESLPGVVVATGLGAEGLTYGPYQGMVAAELAMGNASETDLTPFRPDRAAAV
ncbi:D-amino-acid dehydrogenase [Spinactinospora alkalitolerans]|uniref:D-amino-acid dehydrogenase n=1 Tax=Spinactinospora alkalitolerans TaxID=687207 RepID=A0A852TUV9_9ACTN|nr:FAD-binding oxidoreductase [Spinactinospora alkalitolerans]NYE47471.1 D-amino-acid dehydrogenase [Spinactinospora alkalitolerans]